MVGNTEVGDSIAGDGSFVVALFGFVGVVALSFVAVGIASVAFAVDIGIVAV